MTDFYALLKQSILDRGLSDADDRHEVYAQARRAVIKQLWDFRPPLAADEIDMRVGSYDTAVERIETELRQVFASKPASKPAGKAPGQKATPPRRQAPEPVRSATYAREQGQSTALAEWAREQPDYAPPTRRAVAPYTPPPEAEAANDDYEDEAYEEAEEAAYEEEEEAPPPPARGRSAPAQRPRMDRWSANAARQAAPTKFDIQDWLGWLGTGEQLKVRLLAIGVGTMVVILVGIGAYVLGARSAQAPGGSVRTEVSDAATAARIPNENATVSASYALFDGRDPRVFATTPDNPVYFDDNNGFARITSSTSAAGVKALIGPGLAARLAGQNVRIVITARASQEAGAASMRFAYQSGLAISHWQTANLSSDFTQLGMEWRVPTMRTSADGGDALIIEPGIPGDGTGMDIKAIRIDVLGS